MFIFSVSTFYYYGMVWHVVIENNGIQVQNAENVLKIRTISCIYNNFEINDIRLLIIIYAYEIKHFGSKNGTFYKGKRFF